jgi:hypothetical protein
MKRPAGVIFIAIVDFFFGACLGVGALLFFAGGSFMQRIIASAPNMPANAGDMMAKAGAVIGVVLLVWAAICILVGWGLLALQNWGRFVNVAFTVIALLLSILGFVRGGATGGSSMIVSIAFLVYYAWATWYLLSAGVARAFTRTPSAA